MQPYAHSLNLVLIDCANLIPNVAKISSWQNLCVFINDHLKAVEARGFLHHVEKFCFIASLITFDRILSCTNSLSISYKVSKLICHQQLI